MFENQTIIKNFKDISKLVFFTFTYWKIGTAARNKLKTTSHLDYFRKSNNKLTTVDLKTLSKMEHSVQMLLLIEGFFFNIWNVYFSPYSIWYCYFYKVWFFNFSLAKKWSFLYYLCSTKFITIFVFSLKFMVSNILQEIA